MIESLKKFWTLCRENVSYQNWYDFTAHFVLIGSIIFMACTAWDSELVGLSHRYRVLVFWVSVGVATLLFWKADKVRSAMTASEDSQPPKWLYRCWEVKNWGTAFAIIGFLFVVPDFLLG